MKLTIELLTSLICFNRARGGRESSFRLSFAAILPDPNHVLDVVQLFSKEMVDYSNSLSHVLSLDF